MMDPSFDPNDRKEKGEFTFSLNLKPFKSRIDHHDFFFGDLFDSQTRLIENKYGIHDGSSEGFNKPGVFDNSGEITIFDSYEIEDFYGCCKEWYLFFDSLDMIQNDDK